MYNNHDDKIKAKEEFKFRNFIAIRSIMSKISAQSQWLWAFLLNLTKFGSEFVWYIHGMCKEYFSLYILFSFPPPLCMIFENRIASTKTRSERHLMIRHDGIILPLMDSIMQEQYLSGRKSGLESRFAMTFV